MDNITEIIEIELERIKSQIIGGKIYGREIDENNTDELIIAAYYLGKYESLLVPENNI